MIWRERNKINTNARAATSSERKRQHHPIMTMRESEGKPNEINKKNGLFSIEKNRKSIGITYTRTHSALTCSHIRTYMRSHQRRTGKWKYTAVTQSPHLFLSSIIFFFFDILSQYFFWLFSVYFCFGYFHSFSLYVQLTTLTLSGVRERAHTRKHRILLDLLHSAFKTTIRFVAILLYFHFMRTRCNVNNRHRNEIGTKSDVRVEARSVTSGGSHGATACD